MRKKRREKFATTRRQEEKGKFTNTGVESWGTKRELGTVKVCSLDDDTEKVFLQRRKQKVASVLGLFFRVIRAILHDSCDVWSGSRFRNGTVRLIRRKGR